MPVAAFPMLVQAALMPPPGRQPYHLLCKDYKYRMERRGMVVSFRQHLKEVQTQLVAVASCLAACEPGDAAVVMGE